MMGSHGGLAALAVTLIAAAAAHAASAPDVAAPAAGVAAGARSLLDALPRDATGERTATCESCHPGKMVDTMRRDHERRAPAAGTGAASGSPGPASPLPLPPETMGRICADGAPGWALLLATVTRTDGLAGCDHCHVEGRTPPAPASGAPGRAPGSDRCIGCHANRLDLVVAGGYPAAAGEPDPTGARCLPCHVGAPNALSAARGLAGEGGDVHVRALDPGDGGDLARGCFACHLEASHRSAESDPAPASPSHGGVAATTCAAPACHPAPVHHDARLDDHVEILACAVCHVRRASAVTIDYSAPIRGPDGRYAPAVLLAPSRPRLRWVWERRDAAFARAGGPARQGSQRAKLQPFVPTEVVVPVDARRPLPGTYDGKLVMPLDLALYASTGDATAAALAGAARAGLATSGEVRFEAIDATRLVSLDHGITPAAEAMVCGECHVRTRWLAPARLLDGQSPYDPYADGRLRADFPHRTPSKQHADLEGECGACHGDFRLDDVNRSCATAECHAAILGTHHGLTARAGARAGEEDCAECHREHEDRGSITELTPSACQASGCHALAHGGTQLVRPVDRGAARARSSQAPLSVGLYFSHREHIAILESEGRASDCLACHVEDERRELRIPSHEGRNGCAGGDGECHVAAVPIEEARKQAGKPCLECHVRPGGEREPLPVRSAHVRFTHRDHFEAGRERRPAGSAAAERLFDAAGALACRECHVGDFDGNERFAEVFRQPGDYPRPMEACVACHRDARAAELRCESCHRYHFQDAAGARP